MGIEKNYEVAKLLEEIQTENRKMKIKLVVTLSALAILCLIVLGVSCTKNSTKVPESVCTLCGHVE
jgi:hypothetical protein